MAVITPDSLRSAQGVRRKMSAGFVSQPCCVTLNSMKALLVLLGAVSLLFAAVPPLPASQVYIGFDRNVYPGDDALPILRKFFSFSGYWLSPPPGEKTNGWTRKRALLKQHGFGFLLLYQSAASSHLQDLSTAENAGRADAEKAADAALREGFPLHSVIFLDIEDGGRLSNSVHGYLRAWARELNLRHFRAGVYCSGIPVDEGGGRSIVTADDIRAHIAPLEVSYWVYNDACPPSPGCVLAPRGLTPAASKVSYASVWQFVRSPREGEVASRCTGFAPDDNCYFPLDTARRWHLDLNVAMSPDPSVPH